MTNSDFNPRLYVGTYHKYNCGSLKGKWVDLADFDSQDDFYSYCKELHSDERDPEYMFQDFEGMPHDLYNESRASELIWEMLDLDEDQLKQVYLYHEATGYDMAECIENYENMFYFERESAWDTMFELHPKLSEVEKLNLDFVHISEHDFIQQYATVEYEGVQYCVDTN